MSTATEEAPAAKASEALGKLLKSDYCIQQEMWSNIHFTDRGMARLQHTIGFLKGLTMCDKTDLAEELATDLCDKLTWLNGYGGIDECPPDSERPDAGMVKMPTYRVVLCDDGTFGGFGVLWYRRIAPQTWRQHMNANPCAADEAWNWWQDRLNEKAKVRKELTINRYYYPIINGVEAERMEMQTIRYAYSMNGGLLFHGFGNQTLAVSLDAAMGKKVWWSIHT